MSQVDNVIVFDFYDSDNSSTEHLATTITSLPASGTLYNYDQTAANNRGSAITSVPAALTDITKVILLAGSLNAFEPTRMTFLVTDLWGAESEVIRHIRCFLVFSLQKISLNIGKPHRAYDGSWCGSSGHLQ